MKFAFYSIAAFYLALVAAVNQTSASETPESKQGGSIFAGADELTTTSIIALKTVTAKPTIAKASKTPAPTLMVTQSKSGKASTPAPTALLTPGFVISGDDQSFEIVECDAVSVEIKGSRAEEIKQGNFIIYTPHGRNACSTCNPLFRKVKSISTSPLTGNLILTTTFLTVSEILQVGVNLEDIALGTEIMEYLFHCHHSFTVHYERPEADTLPTPPTLLSEDLSLLTGTCNDNWLQKNADGRCTHTECYVGVSGNPEDCFECKDKCDNGCGTLGFTTDGKFDGYDFGPACCNHDYCYSSSSYTKNECDYIFYNKMMNQCPLPTKTMFSLGFPVTVPNLTYLGCDATATTFFGVAQSSVGALAHSSAQSDQELHELQSVCLAKCPFHMSGGQGMTVRNIDFLRNACSGNEFPVHFQVLTDKLVVLLIEYDGEVIFSTYGANIDAITDVRVGLFWSSTIKVTVIALDEGTEWDLNVECLYPLLCCHLAG
jgi:hypothetical protein